MLDRFLIFTKTGVVLWSITFLPPEPAAATSASSAAAPLDPTTAAVNTLVHDVLIPSRAGAGGAASATSLDTPDYTLQWAVDNGTDTVFAAVIPRQFAPLVSYVGTLLASVRTVFVERFGDRLRAAAASGGADGGSFEFRPAFEKLLDAAERSSATASAGPGAGAGGTPSKRGGGVPAPPPPSSASKAQPAAAAAATAAAAAAVTPAASNNDNSFDHGSDEDDDEPPPPPGGVMSASAIAAARARLAARASAGGKGGAKPASGSKAPSSGGAGGKGGGGKGARQWDDFTYSRDKEASLDKSGASAGAGVEAAAVERVTYSGTGASGSGKGLAEDDDLDADSIVAAAAAAEAAAAAGGGKGAGAASGSGAAAAAGGGTGLSSWLSHTRVGTFLSSLAGTKVLDRADLAPVIEALQAQLISKNVASDVAGALCEGVAGQLVGRRLEAAGSVAAAFTGALRSSCERLLTPRRPVDVLAELRAKKAAGGGPYVIVFVGINGVGKSTSLSKVAFHLRDHGHSVLIAACDSFRAGAVEQLKRHCTALDVPLFQQGYAKDPVTIASAAIKEATEQKLDCVLVDTAGRMQNNGPLMQQLAKLVAVNRPDLVLMVAEALVGSDGVDQLTSFDRALVDYAVDRSAPRRIDGVLLTKFDTVDDKVGAALSMVYTTGIPVVYLGTGQKYADLRKLNVGAVVKALLA